MQKIIDYFNEEAKVHDDRSLNQMGMAEFYDEIEVQVNRCSKKENILILGCGTGLEIERIKFECNVTAIDISPEMLNELHKKTFYDGLKLKTICASLLDVDFGQECFDIVLSCYTLHHFSITQKAELYCKIYRCLLPTGVMINGDIVSKSTDEESQKINCAEKSYALANLPFGSLHIDVPLTLERELSLIHEAGFQRYSLEKEWSNTKLYRCMK